MTYLVPGCYQIKDSTHMLIVEPGSLVDYVRPESSTEELLTLVISDISDVINQLTEVDVTYDDYSD